MSCKKGSATPNSQTKLKLFALSGGYCQKPDCNRLLFHETKNCDFHIAEMAHVFSASDDGPRAKIKLSKEERGRFENLILLCPTCHTMVDKAEKDFPDSLMLEWKSKHLEKIKKIFEIREYSCREEARLEIQPLLNQNRMVFNQYGPETDVRYNPESDLPQIWRRKIFEIIIPNNRKILAILDHNRVLLTLDEGKILESFRQHIDDFEAKHIGGFHYSGVSFPIGMESILGDNNDKIK